MIRTKLIIATILSVVVLTSTLYTVSVIVLLKSYEEIEHTLMEENLVRIRGALDNYSNALNIKLRDWAQWDDSYQFVTDKNTTYEESNLADTTLVNLEINLILFVNTEREVVYAKLVDLSSDSAIPSEALVEELMGKEDLIRRIEDQQYSSDILKLTEGLLAIEGRPILPTDGHGDARGYLFFARFVDPELLQSLAELTQLPIELFNLTSSLPPDIDAAHATLEVGQGDFSISPVSKDSITGYFLLRDNGGTPTSIIRTTTQRDIYAQGRSTITTFTTIAGVAIFLFGIVILFLFEKILLRRFVRLGREMEAISVTNLKNIHVFEGEKDEFGILVTRINGLLTELSATQQKELVTRDYLKEALERTVKINKHMVDRELRMAELKNEIKQLKGEKDTPEEVV